MLLDIEKLTIKFGGLAAINNLDIQLEAGHIYGLIGPNGAGKTTLFNLISGVYAPTAGKIFFDGKQINGMQPFQINKLGVSRTYQVINLFKKMTVMENVLVGMQSQTSASFLSSIFHTKKERLEEKESYQKALEWLDFVELRGRAQDLAGSLSYGEQRLLEIGRALAGKPKLILLDEPAAGMNDTEKAQLREYVNRVLNELGITVLVIEHDMKLMMGLAEYIYVLNFGEKLAQGTPQEIQTNQDVLTAYLGDE
jgi:ABC-type branched-chain amino acid transport systems, ATPase component